MPHSLKDVALLAGVSQATVSRVLNSKEGARIPEATQERVRQAASSCGYQPNRMARSLREGRTRTIGLMISGLGNPYFLGLMEAIETRVLAAGYDVMLGTAPTVRGSYFEHRKLRDWPVDGVIMWGQSDQDLGMFVRDCRTTTPVVYLGGPREGGADYVAFDLYRGAQTLVGYLAQSGYRRLTYVCPYNFAARPDPDPRVLSFYKTCAATGCEPDFHIMQIEAETKTAGLQAGLTIATLPNSKRPDALVCHNDVIAVGAYHGLLRGGLRVPQDIAVAGFDGIEDGQCLDKPLTTILTSTDDMAKEAVEILLARLEGDTGSGRQVTLAGTLLVGETS